MADTVIGALSVEISVDSQGVRDGLEATGSALRIGGKELRKSVNEWGKWATGAVAAVSAVTAAIVKSNLSGIRELKNSATAADETVAAFQRGAFAAKKFGIEQDEYGQILMDVNDRVGDFLLTGAGPMIDFFDTVGKKVGVTAEDFRNLSGSQSMGLYINSMQKAGATQQEMTFLMEALGGDATMLIPLFKDNAKVFNTLTGEAKALGIGLSDIDIKKAEMASGSLAKSLGVTKAFGQELTVALAPILGSVIDLFEDMAKEAGGAGQFIQTAISGIVDIVGIFANGLFGVALIFKTLEVAAIGFSALAVSVFQAVTNIIATSIDGWIGIVNTAVTAMNSVFDTGISEIPEVRSSKFMNGINEVGDNMRGLVAQTNGELAEMASKELPSEQIKNFVDTAVSEYERVATAKVAADNLASAKDDKATGINGNAGESAEAIRIREQEDAILATLLEAGGLKEEALLDRLARERVILDDALRLKKTTEEAYANASLALTEKTEKAKSNIVTSTLDSIATAIGLGGKKGLKAQKAISIVSAVIKGKEAAVAAWSAGMATGGPWAPFVAASYAASSIAQTASMISSIKGGSKSVGSMGGGGMASPSRGGAGSGGGEQGSESSSRNIAINFTGEGMFSTDQVRGLINQINEQVGDGISIQTLGEN